MTRAIVIAASLIVCAAASLGAQGVTRTQVLLGVGVSALQTSHPEGGPLALGGSIGVAKNFSERTSVRAILGVTRSIILSDGVSVCYRQPNGSCLPDAVFHRWLSTAALEAAVRPVRRAPLGITVGTGLARSDGAGEGRRNAPVISESRTRGLWRAGLELSLGRSPRSPRIQLSRTGFSSSLYSTTFVDALVLSLSP